MLVAPVGTVSVEFFTADDTAFADEDYLAAAGTVVFPDTPERVLTITEKRSCSASRASSNCGFASGWCSSR